MLCILALPTHILQVKIVYSTIFFPLPFLGRVGEPTLLYILCSTLYFMKGNEAPEITLKMCLTASSLSSSGFFCATAAQMTEASEMMINVQDWLEGVQVKNTTFSISSP